VTGDLLAFPTSFIAHQCYCVASTRSAGGLAFNLFQRFPHANVYVVLCCPLECIASIGASGSRSNNRMSRPVRLTVTRAQSSRDSWPRCVLYGAGTSNALRTRCQAPLAWFHLFLAGTYLVSSTCSARWSLVATACHRTPKPTVRGEGRPCGLRHCCQCLRPSACVLPWCPHALTLECATRSSHHHCMCVPIAGTSVRPCRASRNFSTLAPLGTAAVVLLSQKELGAASPAATGHGTLRFWTPSPTLCLCPCTS
jgi:hypothetical protein